MLERHLGWTRVGLTSDPLLVSPRPLRMRLADPAPVRDLRLRPFVHPADGPPMTPVRQGGDWLAEATAEARRQWRELPVWARPVYVTPMDCPYNETEDEECE